MQSRMNPDVSEICIKDPIRTMFLAWLRVHVVLCEAILCMIRSSRSIFLISDVSWTLEILPIAFGRWQYFEHEMPPKHSLSLSICFWDDLLLTHGRIARRPSVGLVSMNWQFFGEYQRTGSGEFKLSNIYRYCSKVLGYCLFVEISRFVPLSKRSRLAGASKHSLRLFHRPARLSIQPEVSRAVVIVVKS